MIPASCPTHPVSTIRPPRRWPVLGLGILALCLLVAPGGLAREQVAAGDSKNAPAVAYHLPVAFVPNVGQAPPQVLFEGRLFGAVVGATSHGLVFPDGRRLAFVNTGGPARVRPVGRLPGVVNFLLGDDPQQWHTNVPTYRRLRYEELYPGVTVELGGGSQGLAATFHLAPGAAVERVAWRLERASPGTGDTRWRKSAEGSRSLRGMEEPLQRLAPALADAEGPVTVVLDLGYGSYLGGSRDESAAAVAVDAQGNTYVTGETLSADFPTQGPLQPRISSQEDAFVTKINPAGSALVYSTYLGGNQEDAGSDIAVDGRGRAHVAGYTESGDFPRAGAIQDRFGGGSTDGFVAVLSPDGSQLEFGSFIGGRDADRVSGLALRPGPGPSPILLVGSTLSTNFPTVNALQGRHGGSGDAFATAIAPDRSAYLYSTYLGGSRAERGLAVAADASGAVYLTGYSEGPGFPLVNPIQRGWRGESDAFVAKLAADGSALVYSTYLGGSDSDQGQSIAVVNGEAVVAGYTNSRNFPTHSAYQGQPKGASDGFVARLAADGSALVFSTFLGGTQDDRLWDVAVDQAGNIHLAGASNSTNFPTANPVQNRLRGQDDAVVATLSADGQALLFGTFFGGSQSDYAGAVAVSPGGSLIIAGYTESADLDTSGGFQPRYGSQGDAFVAAMSPGAMPTPQPTSTATRTPPPTATATVPTTPVATSTPTLTSTPTRVPPSATPTQPPPTATPTPTQVEEYLIYLPVAMKQ